MNLMGRDFLTLLDYTKEELEYIIEVAQKLKQKRHEEILKEKTLVMLFQKHSTRTRVSFEAAMTQLGGHAIFLDFTTTQLGRGESISDTGKNISRYCDAIMARLYKHSDLEALAKASTVSVINGLTDLFHPCQTLGDIMTIKEKKGFLSGLKIAFVGDCSFNMFNSTAIGCSKFGMDVNAVCPPDYSPNPNILEKTKKQAIGKIEIIHNPMDGVKDVDTIYTDTWVSMGQEQEKEQRIRDLKPYQVNSELIKHAKKDVIVMHCLPAYRGLEITDEVIDGPNSVVFDQAENRLHIQKGILSCLIGNVSNI